MHGRNTNSCVCLDVQARVVVCLRVCLTTVNGDGDNEKRDNTKEKVGWLGDEAQIPCAMSFGYKEESQSLALLHHKEGRGGVVCRGRVLG